MSRPPSASGGIARPGEKTADATDPANFPPTSAATTSSTRSTATLVLSGNVVMQQGERKHPRRPPRTTTRRTSSAKLEGGVEYSDPNSWSAATAATYSPTLGATFRGHGVRTAGRGARGSATNLRVDGQSKVTLEGVTFTTCPANQVDWQLQARQIELDTQTRNGTGRGTKVEFKGVPSSTCPG